MKEEALRLNASTRELCPPHLFYFSLDLDLQPAGLTVGVAGHPVSARKRSDFYRGFLRLLQAKQFHILSTAGIQVRRTCLPGPAR